MDITGNKSFIFKLGPYVSHKIWGGDTLTDLFSKKEDGQKIGEIISVSTLIGQSSFYGNRPFYQIYTDKEDCPYVIKFIDTSDNLSIQVHPCDEMAFHLEKSSGKMECWLITEVKGKNAGIYLGLKEGVTQEIFESQLEKNKKIDSLMNFHEVQKGDFFLVPAGTLHAIGANVTLLEVQQRSGITYRVWDWGRVDDQGNSRELHKSKALKCLNFDSSFNLKLKDYFKKNVFQSGYKNLVSHKNFTLDVHKEKKGSIIKLSSSTKRLSSIVCLEGKLELSHSDGEKIILYPYEAAAISINDNYVSLQTLTESTFIYVY